MQVVDDRQEHSDRKKKIDSHAHPKHGRLFFLIVNEIPVANFATMDCPCDVRKDGR